MRGQQFLGAEDAEGVEQLRADLVLSAVAARRRHQRHPHPEAARVPRQHCIVLVVGMRGRLHQGADGVQLAEGHGQAWRARQVADLRDPYCGERCWAAPAKAKLPINRARRMRNRVCIKR